jgi:hypothetical protein
VGIVVANGLDEEGIDVTSLPPALPALSTRERRRFLIGALVRAGSATLLVLLAYYLLPLDRIPDGTLFLTLALAMVFLTAVASWQVRRVLDAATPLLIAIEALAVTVPLFLVTFAAMYFTLATNATGNFNVSTMTRTDAMYFTVTVFTTVGFGDITATSQLARALVTVQMLLDLIVIGLVIRVFFGAGQHAWKTNVDAIDDDPATDPREPKT